MMTRASLLLVLTAVCLPLPLRAEKEDLDKARAATAKAFGVPASKVKGDWEGILAHLEAYSFTVEGDGYTARVHFAKPTQRITHVTFRYEDDYEPDPDWAEMEAWEAMTHHLRRLKMSVPTAVRMAEMKKLRRGDGHQVIMRYERKLDATVAPLWLDGTLDATDHRPIGLNAIDYPLTVSAEPTVSKADAIEMALSKADEGKRGHVETKLRVWFREDHSQVLWWDIKVHESDEESCGISLLIDAHSGKIDHVLGF